MFPVSGKLRLLAKEVDLSADGTVTVVFSRALTVAGANTITPDTMTPIIWAIGPCSFRFLFVFLWLRLFAPAVLSTGPKPSIAPFVGQHSFRDYGRQQVRAH